MSRAIGRIALGETRWVAGTIWIEKDGFVDTESMSPILMPAPAVDLPPAAPGGGCIGNLMALAQNRMVSALCSTCCTIGARAIVAAMSR
jgi:hypothetical protein